MASADKLAGKPCIGDIEIEVLTGRVALPPKFVVRSLKLRYSVYTTVYIGLSVGRFGGPSVGWCGVVSGVRRSVRRWVRAVTTPVGRFDFHETWLGQNKQ